MQCALAAALVNIKLPLLVGDVVNVVSKYAKENTGNFLEEIQKPAMKLVSTYLIQVNVFIILLNYLFIGTIICIT